MSETSRILLADDHALLRQGLRLIIEREPDLRVVAEAGNGREAVEQALAHRPDLAILDVAMPGLNGLGACPSNSDRSEMCRFRGYKNVSEGARRAAERLTEPR